MKTIGQMTEAERLSVAALLLSQALIDVEVIRDRPPQGLYPTYRNELERHRDRRTFSIKDASKRATSAATLMRKAWMLLDPTQDDLTKIVTL